MALSGSYKQTKETGKTGDTRNAFHFSTMEMRNVPSVFFLFVGPYIPKDANLPAAVLKSPVPILTGG